MAVDRLAITPAPQTPPRYDSENETAFRRLVDDMWFQVDSALARLSESQTSYAEMGFDGGSTAFVVNANAEAHGFHSADMVAGELAGWTFDAGSAGTPLAITSVADGTGGTILVTTATHGLAVGDIVSHTNLTDSAYVGVFVVQAVPSPTTYKVTATYTATGTGTMDQPATLTCNDGHAGLYVLSWHASGSGAGASTVFDYDIYLNADKVSRAGAERKFGGSGDVGAFGGGRLGSVNAGDKVSFILQNVTSATDLTLVIFNLNLVRH